MQDDKDRMTDISCTCWRPRDLALKVECSATADRGAQPMGKRWHRYAISPDPKSADGECLVHA